jgi:hypothetical protein
MPFELFGGRLAPPDTSREWIDAECQLVIKHLKKICGEPQPEMEREVQGQEDKDTEGKLAKQTGTTV